ncbi:hypothetical protein RCS94_09330 [Orbaceae bacterium ac157xtp]
MPIDSINFLIEMHQETADEIFSAFKDDQDLDTVLEIEQEYLDLVDTFVKNENMVSQILTYLNSDHDSDINNQIALLGLSSERDEHWQYVLNTLFPESLEYFNPIDFRWLLSRVPSSRQYEIIHFMTANPKRFYPRFSELEEFIFDNRIESLYSLFVKNDGELVYPVNKRGYSILALQGKKEKLRELLRNEEDDFTQTYIARWLMYAGDESALDFLSQKPVFTEDLFNHAPKFCSLKRLPWLKDLLFVERDSTLIYNINRLIPVGSTELIPLFFNLLSHNNPSVAENAHEAITSFFPKDSDVWQNAEYLIREQEFDQNEVIQFWRTIDQPAPNVRYFQGEVFDIRNILERNRTSPMRHNLSDLIFDISVWTGQQFAIDPCAPFEKQFQQYNEIEQWFEENDDQCLSNKWMLYGQER